MIALDLRDRKLAISSLATLADEDENYDEVTALRLEWQRLLMLGVKCEIQWLDESGNINAWLEKQIRNALE